MSGKKFKFIKKRYIVFFIVTLFLLGFLAISVNNLKQMENSKNSENNNQNPLDDIITDDSSLKIDAEENLSNVKLNVKKTLTIESGDELPDIEDYFFEDKVDNLFFLHYYNDDGNELDSTSFTYTKDDKKITKGKHEIGIIIKKEDQRFDSTLIIKDTTPPIVTLKELTIDYGDRFFALDFIESYSDNSSESEYIVKFVNNQNNLPVGSHNIDLKICDLANNCIEKNTKIIVNNSNNDSNNNNNNNDNNDNNENNNDNGNENNNNNDNNGNENNNSNDNNSSENDPNVGDDDNSSENNNDKPVENPDDDTSSDDNSNTEIPKYLETITEERTISTENRYGTKIYKNGLVTYELYSDGSIVILNTKNIYYTVDFSGYNGTTSQLKPEAIQTYNNSELTRNNILMKTNEYRQAVGLHNLVIDKELSIMASIRAMELAYSNTFAHTRPNGDSWFTLWNEYGYSFKAGSLYGENLALNYSSDFAACEGWRNSSSHYANMINSRYNKFCRKRNNTGHNK